MKILQYYPYNGNHRANVKLLKLSCLVEKQNCDVRTSANFATVRCGSRRGRYLTAIYCGSVVLKRCLLMCSDLIFGSRVDPGMPSLAAAPDGPPTRPPLSRRAASMISFSWAAGLRNSPRSLLGPVTWGGRESQLSSTEKFSVSHTITDRSMTFCNSRMLPGQGHD